MSTAPDSPSPRLHQLDFLRGALVLAILAFHCASSASDRYPVLRTVMRSLNWTHASFLVVAGFLCGWHYAGGGPDSGRSPQARLRQRGGKLLALFITGNALIYATCLGPRQRLAELATAHGFMEHVVIRFSGRLFACEILAYIGVFLLLASCLIGTSRRWPEWALFGLTAVLAGASPTARFIAMGLVGMVLGRWARRGGESLILEPGPGPTVMAAVATAAWQMALLSGACPALPRLLMVPLHSLECGLWFTVILGVHRCLCAGHLRRAITVLGRYSLVGYVGQVILARICAATLTGLPVAVYYVVSVLAVGAALAIGIRILDACRRRYAVVDRAYRLICG